MTDIDEFLARSEDILEDWQGSDDAMSVRDGSVGGTYFAMDESPEYRMIAAGHGSAVFGRDLRERLSTAFNVPLDMLLGGGSDDVHVQIRAQTEGYVRAADDAHFRQLSADRIPGSAYDRHDRKVRVFKAVEGERWIAFHVSGSLRCGLLGVADDQESAMVIATSHARLHYDHPEMFEI